MNDEYSVNIHSESFEVFLKELKELNVIKYGHDGQCYWYETPDGVRGRSFTRGKMLAALSAVRIHNPGIKLQLVGKLPKRKEKK